MSKKSRKRNKRILGALGALGLGLALANRGKGTEMSNISVGGGKDASTMKTGTGKTIMDNMPVIPKKKSSNVQPEVITRGSGVMISDTGQKVPAPKNNKLPYLNRMADKKRLDALRGFRSDRAYRGDMMTTPDSIIEGVPLEDYMISAKKGGRIVKGKKTAVRKVGIAKRGFGRAMKRSK